ncbi:uncharacterized protein [Eucyclogobius newberryi]|uniref:uncharacterized protein n=1 Tax=Eucyclogobius newberryi TaxID=166745 RepID=UPI003B59B20E
MEVTSTDSTTKEISADQCSQRKANDSPLIIDSGPNPSVTMKKKPNGQPYIKKPPNAFMLFRAEQRQNVVDELHITDSAKVNVVLGQRWKMMSDQEQAQYFEKAHKERRAHEAKYPGWSPIDNCGKKAKRRRADKILDPPIHHQVPLKPANQQPVMTWPYAPANQQPAMTWSYAPANQQPVLTWPYAHANQRPVLTRPYPPANQLPMLTWPYVPANQQPVMTWPYAPVNQQPVMTWPYAPANQQLVMTWPYAKQK